MTVKDYYHDPFGFMDNLNLTFRGNNLNLFQKHVRLRKMSFSIAVTALVCWIIFGFDSTPLQFIHVLYEGIPTFLAGQASLADLAGIYNSYYGKEMHYSAFVIYGLTFWFLNRHFDKNLSIVKSKNITYAAGITFLSIATFEFFWINSFAFFQNQPWVATWQMPQLRILVQNLLFLIVGCFAVAYMFLDSYELDGNQDATGKRFYRFRIDWIALALVLLTMASAVVWIYYPWGVEQISVTLETGEVWRSTHLFPQTLYTVDLNPLDKVNAGTWFWVENNLIHGWNTLVKVLWTLVFVYIGKVKTLYL